MKRRIDNMEEKYRQGYVDLTSEEPTIPNEIKLNLRDFLDETQLDSFYKSLKEYLEDEYQGDKCCGFNVSVITISDMDWCEKEITYEVCSGNYVEAEFETLGEAKKFAKQNGYGEIIQVTDYLDKKGNHYDTDYETVYKKEEE
jgi:hypothetical protein